MLRPYVRTSERVLYGFSLAFSLVVYAAIIAGMTLAGIAAYKSLQTASSYEIADEMALEALPQFEEEIPLEGEAELIEEEFVDEDFVDEEFVEGEIIEGEDLGEYTEGDFSEEKYSDDEYAEYEDFYGESYGSSPSFSNIGAMAGPVTLVIVLLYIILLLVFVVGGHILAVGYLMGNGVRVSEKQFPELWASFIKAAAVLGVRRLPAFYLVEAGGLMNAFATRLFTRNYVAIYSDLAERLYEGDAESVDFVIAHELVHVRRNHAFKSLFTLPAEAIPFLKAAWRRACEYTCDSGGAEFSPSGAEKGLILLAAGKKLSARMDANAYLESFLAEKSIWKRISEVFSSHPHLPKRIAALRKRV